MRRLPLAIIFFFLLNSSIKAQYVFLVNPGMRSALMAIYPGCINAQGWLDTTCTAITTATRLTLRRASGTSPAITSLSGLQYFDSLKYLDCSSNELTSLTGLPRTLDTLICRSQTTPNFINYFALGSIGGLPEGLIYLDCSSNGISSMSLPNNLKWLDCSMQRHHYSWGGTIPELYSIDTIPASLEYFNCSKNGLSNLPTLPSSLKYLNASGNKSFYTIPQSGQIVRIRGISSLPVLSASLEYLNVGANSISEIPALPANLRFLDCSSNDSLRCLPELPFSMSGNSQYNVQNYNLNTAQTLINCLPNNVTGMISAVTLPICSASNNTNGCTLITTPGTINVTTTLVSLQTTVGVASVAGRFTLTGSSLFPISGPITITPSANLEVSLNNITFSSLPIVKNYNNGSLSTTFVYVRIVSTAQLGTFTGTIAFTGGNAANVIKTVNASVLPGTIPGIINVTASSVSIQTTIGVSSIAGRFTLTGSSLFPISGPITITPSVNLEVSLNNTTFSSLPIIKNYNNGSLSTTFVYVRIVNTAPLGNFTGTVTFTGGNAANVIRTVNASVLPGTTAGIINATPSSVSIQSTIGVSSIAGRFTLTGSSLFPISGAITITPSANLEVSLNNSTFSTLPIVKHYNNGSLSTTFVYVRIVNTAPPGNFTGSITFTGGNAPVKVNNVISTVTTRGLFTKQEETTNSGLINAENSSIDLHNKSKEFSLYPNPTKLYVIIYLPNFRKSNVVDIYNIYGKQVLHVPITGIYTKVDLKILSKGVYIAKIYGDDLGYVKQFVVD